MSLTFNFSPAVKGPFIPAFALIVKPVTSILADSAPDTLSDLDAFLQSSAVPVPREDSELQFDGWETEFNHY